MIFYKLLRFLLSIEVLFGDYCGILVWRGLFISDWISCPPLQRRTPGALWLVCLLIRNDSLITQGVVENYIHQEPCDATRPHAGQQTSVCVCVCVCVCVWRWTFPPPPCDPGRPHAITEKQEERSFCWRLCFIRWGYHVEHAMSGSVGWLNKGLSWDLIKYGFSIHIFTVNLQWISWIPFERKVLWRPERHFEDQTSQQSLKTVKCVSILCAYLNAITFVLIKPFCT